MVVHQPDGHEAEVPFLAVVSAAIVGLWPVGPGASVSRQDVLAGLVPLLAGIWR